MLMTHPQKIKPGAAKKAGILFVLCAATAIATPAQTFTSLYSFCAQGGSNCTDGANPGAGLVQGTGGNSGYFYGTTQNGGANGAGFGGYGTVFSITPAGARTTLYSFNATDGEWPSAGLVLGAVGSTVGNFYGTTQNGGANDNGTVFSITAGGTRTTLYNFCSQSGCKDGAVPTAGLVQDSAGNFYGVTQESGANGFGEVFKLTLSGSTLTFKVVYSFCSQTDCADGVYPSAGLVLDSSGNLYGTAPCTGVETTINAWWNPIAFPGIQKQTALVVWAVSDGGANTATPSFVATPVTCSGSDAGLGPMPDYLGTTGTTFQSAYTAFLTALFQQYGNDPRIAYIRVGLADGGETFPTCLAELESYDGLSDPLFQTQWTSYVTGMLATMNTIRTGPPTYNLAPGMVALDCFESCATHGTTFPDAVANAAAGYGFGIGQEAFSQPDITNYGMGQPCTADWCNEFNTQGSVFHELQFNPNFPGGGTPTTLLPFATLLKTNVVEMSPCLTQGTGCELPVLAVAYDPGYMWSGEGPIDQCNYQQAIATFEGKAPICTPPAVPGLLGRILAFIKQLLVGLFHFLFGWIRI
jgi:uncharacterized repeat protein (TIGR03803 family)